MTQDDLDRVVRGVKRKYPIMAGLALNDVEVKLSREVETAAVVGEKDDKGVIHVKCIEVNPDFFDKLSFSERVFVIAHESLHIAFKHFARSIQRPERDAKRKFEEYCEHESDPIKRERMKVILHNRYQNMWNIATDACINAFLRKDGFSFPQNIIDSRTGEPMKFVDMEEGFYKSAEKIYDYLYQKQEEKEREEQLERDQQGQSSDSQSAQGDENQQGQSSDSQSAQGDENQQGQSSDSQSAQGDENQQGQGIDNQSAQDKEQTESNSNGMSSKSPALDDIDIDNYHGFDSHDSWSGGDNEIQQNSDNNSQEEEIDEEEMMEQEQKRRKEQRQKQSSLKDSFSKLRESQGLGNFVPFKPVLSWKRLLVGTLEKDVEVWGYRRASRYNPNPRIEDRMEESRASVEVLLDVSGSISVDLLRGFLLQLYPILSELSGDEELSMKVGCFSTYFSGWKTIRSRKDIDSFNPYIGGGTDFEVAATSFTKDPGRTITKIVFTDGELGYPQFTKIPDIIWIVFGNHMNFSPVGGRIIKVSDEEYREMVTQNLLFDTEKKTDDLGKVL